MKNLKRTKIVRSLLSPRHDFASINVHCELNDYNELNITLSWRCKFWTQACKLLPPTVKGLYLLRMRRLWAFSWPRGCPFLRLRWVNLRESSWKGIITFIGGKHNLFPHYRCSVPFIPLKRLCVLFYKICRRERTKYFKAVDHAERVWCSKRHRWGRRRRQKRYGKSLVACAMFIFFFYFHFSA